VSEIDTIIINDLKLFTYTVITKECSVDIVSDNIYIAYNYNQSYQITIEVCQQSERNRRMCNKHAFRVVVDDNVINILSPLNTFNFNLVDYSVNKFYSFLRGVIFNYVKSNCLFYTNVEGFARESGRLYGVR
jgi:hypothetical protein